MLSGSEYPLHRSGLIREPTAERLESAEFVRQVNAILDEKAGRDAAVALLNIDAGAVALKDGLV